MSERKLGEIPNKENSVCIIKAQTDWWNKKGDTGCKRVIQKR